MSEDPMAEDGSPGPPPALKIDEDEDQLQTKAESPESSYPQIKTEPPALSLETDLPPSPSTKPSVDEATMKAIANAQNEYNTRVRGSKKAQDQPDSPMAETPKPPPSSKKRSAPKSGSATKSAQTSTKKPAKKVKTAADKGDGSSLQTPTVGRGIKSNVNHERKGSKASTPAASSPPEDDIPSSPTGSYVSDTDTVYCICRKPDNHTFMIGCDGGCEDWFHGKCVSVHKEDEDLLDKYICPNCVEKDRGVTTWKPMCRRDGCRRPARLRKGAESKYCSNECGVKFMQNKLASSSNHHHRSKASSVSNNSTKKRTPQKPTSTQYHHRSDSTPSSPELGPLGGPIRPSQLKSLTLASDSYTTFQHLGAPPSALTPPASPTKSSSFTQAEASRLDAISSRKAHLRARRTLLKDRERFVTLAKERAARAADAAKIKDLCGFDARIAWDETSFAAWRASTAGEAAFTRGMLQDDEDGADMAEPAADADTDADTRGRVVPLIRRASASASAGDTAGPPDHHPTTTSTAVPIPADLCPKKRCERHRAWQKLATQDVRFEEADVGDEMRRVDAEEREIRERAAVRAAFGVGIGVGEGEGGEEGVVEVVA